MQFNALGFSLAAAMTGDMQDRARAAQISIIGGMLGSNPTGPLLLAVAAQGSGLKPSLPATPTPASEAPSRVQVPDLPDDEVEAKKVLEAHGLVAAVVMVSSDEPVGCVIGGEPKAGSIVSEGTTINVLVSVGVRVPSVTGMEYADAESVLKAAGFESERRESTKLGKEDVVERQSPEAGGFAEAGSVVTLHVFKPRPRRALRAADSSEDE
jgi:serine/threonine-protein kinase